MRITTLRFRKIEPADGVFDIATENAVREFQRIFNLTPDGIVGKPTWYQLKYIYNGVKRLNELTSEGLTLDEVTRPFPAVLREGATVWMCGLCSIIWM